MHTFYIIDRDDDLAEVHESHARFPTPDDHSAVAAAATAHAIACGGPVYAFHVTGIDNGGRDRSYLHGRAACTFDGAHYRRHGIVPMHEDTVAHALSAFHDALQARRGWLQACRDFAARQGETAEYADAFAEWTVGPYWIRSAAGAPQAGTVDSFYAEWRLVAYT